MKRITLRARGFTLIELLVVISIVAVLMGLAFPAFQGVQNAAKKTQAKNDVTQLVTAVNAFYTEYGKYPLPAGGGPTFGGGTTHRPILDALRGVEPQSTTMLNPKQIVFISPPDAKDQNLPRSGMKTSDQQFYDPWGRSYLLSMDADYDNQVANPYSDSGAGPTNIRQGVLVLSYGKNGALGGGAAAGPNFTKESGTAGAFTGSSDVISWQ
jgi:prepilin-type N-terminal cleavage/methylation domain-containing protein